MGQYQPQSLSGERMEPANSGHLRSVVDTMRLIFRGGVIQLEIALMTLVIVTPALVQTIVDSRPIDNKHDCPYNKQQKRGAEKRSHNQDQLSLPRWCVLFLVLVEH